MNGCVIYTLSDACPTYSSIHPSQTPLPHSNPSISHPFTPQSAPFISFHFTLFHSIHFISFQSNKHPIAKCDMFEPSLRGSLLLLRVLLLEILLRLRDSLGLQTLNEMSVSPSELAGEVTHSDVGTIGSTHYALLLSSPPTSDETHGRQRAQPCASSCRREQALRRSTSGCSERCLHEGSCGESFRAQHA